MSALSHLFAEKPIWTDLDEQRLRQAVRNHLPRKAMLERKHRAIAYDLWKALPLWKRIFTKRPGNG